MPGIFEGYHKEIFAVARNATQETYGISIAERKYDKENSSGKRRESYEF